MHQAVMLRRTIAASLYFDMAYSNLIEEVHIPLILVETQ